MKVLLYEDIKKLGWLGDVVEVNEGYARNYLFPQGLAKKATQENIEAIASEKAVRAQVRIAERKRLEQAVEKVREAAPEVVLAAKANEQGVLFGSITEHPIADNLRQQGFEVADEIVRLSEHIKTVGPHEVVLRFADDLKVEVTVTVVPEQDNIEENEAHQDARVDTVQEADDQDSEEIV